MSTEPRLPADTFAQEVLSNLAQGHLGLVEFVHSIDVRPSWLDRVLAGEVTELPLLTVARYLRQQVSQGRKGAIGIARDHLDQHLPPPGQAILPHQARRTAWSGGLGQALVVPAGLDGNPTPSPRQSAPR